MVDIPKRNLLVKLSTALITLPAALRLASAAAPAQQQSQQPQSLTGQDDPHTPGDRTEAPVLADPKEMLKEHQKKIHDDVEKLFELAGGLKDEVEKTQTEHV